MEADKLFGCHWIVGTLTPPYDSDVPGMRLNKQVLQEQTNKQKTSLLN